MTTWDTIREWKREHPNETIPFWPGAGRTGPFGLRRTQAEIDAGTSPIHLATDRARRGKYALAQPFDGGVDWRRLRGTVMGSILMVRSVDIPLEFHVFHTDALGGEYVNEIESHDHRGMELPVYASNLGLSVGSSGIHTHGMIILPADESVLAGIAGVGVCIVRQGKPDLDYVRAHCRRFGLSEEVFVERLEAQISSWGIEHLTERYAVVKWLPEYRRTQWGTGPTVYVDSWWFLGI